MIIQAIPGSGKSALAEDNPNFFDVDIQIDALSRGQGLGHILKSEQLSNRLFDWIRENLKFGHVLVHFTPEAYGLTAGMRFAYRPDEYVEHLRDYARRVDLLQKFDEATVRKWAEDYTDRDQVIWLRKGEYISNIFL